MSNSWEDPDFYIPDSFWILPIFKTLHSIQSFKNLLLSNNLNPNEMVFSGFKLLIKQTISGYFLDLEREFFLGLTEDHETRRAFFYGTDYNKFTSTCEKANVLRNLQEIFRNLRRSKDFDALQSNMDVMYEKFFMPLEKIFADSVNVDTGITIDRWLLLQLAGMSRLLNPVMRTISYDEEKNSRKTEINERGANDKHLNEISKKKEQRFIGYKAALAFLLGSSVNDKPLLSNIMSAKDVQHLSRLISSAESNVIEQLRQKTGREIAFGKFFSSVKKPNKKLFGEIIQKSSVPPLSLNERLDQLLLWYRFEVIDSAASKIFSGGATFRSLLRGEIDERIDNSIDEKLAVIRFRHPGDVPFFSYAILLERFGSFSDFSGWMIFTEVGGDYNGLGGFEYTSTEQILRQNSEHVDVREFEIDAESLRSYMAIRDPDETEEMKSRISALENRLNDALARLIEFVTKSFFEEQGYESTIYFNDPAVLTDRKEIDVLAINSQKKQIVLIECSTNIGIEINTLIDEINHKVELLKSNPRFKEFIDIEKVFVTSKGSIAGLRSGPEIVSKLNEAGIHVLEIEKIIQNLPKKFRRETLLQLFQSRKQEDYFIL